MVFYRRLLEASLEIAPDRTMRAITEVVRKFQMPVRPAGLPAQGAGESPWPASTTFASTATPC